MTKSNVMQSLARANAFVIAAVLAGAALLPALLLADRADGAQLTNRFIDLSSVQSSGGDSSEGSGRDGGDAAGQDVTYTVGFDIATTGNVGGIVIDFCTNSPIIGDACTGANGDGFDSNHDSGLALANVATLAGFSIDAANSDEDTIIITNGTPQALTSGNSIQFDLGTTAAADGITNPSTVGTFYGRILTYATEAAAQAYVAASEGTYVDDGGAAMAVANELTITARVQEVLEFCIGTDDDSVVAGLTRIPADDCSVVDGTDIDLGVVDSNSTQRTSDADIGTGGNDGLAMIRTNAINGAVVYYKAEQEAGLSNGGEGTLRQAGIDDCTTIGNVNNACFNSAGGDVANPTQAAIADGTELFGMTLTNLDTSAGGATSALSCDANYDGDGSCGGGAATGYAWDPTGAFDTLASSSGPIDDEMVNIEFAATASPTTPTGLYTVTANFVATSTF